GGAVRAAARLEGDGRIAERALPRGGSRRRLRLFESRELAYHEKDHEGDDQEVDHRVEEDAIVERRRPGGLCLGQRRVMLPRQIEEEVLEVHSAENQADRWHQDVVDERGHDLAERAADHDGHGEIHDVAPRDELLELFEHGDLLSGKLPFEDRPDRSRLSPPEEPPGAALSLSRSTRDPSCSTGDPSSSTKSLSRSAKRVSRSTGDPFR